VSANLKKIAVRSSPDPAKIYFSPDPVRSSPVRAHLCYLSVILAPFGSVFGYFWLKTSGNPALAPVHLWFAVMHELGGLWSGEFRIRGFTSPQWCTGSGF